MDLEEMVRFHFKLIFDSHCEISRSVNKKQKYEDIPSSEMWAESDQIYWRMKVEIGKEWKVFLQKYHKLELCPAVQEEVQKF